MKKRQYVSLAINDLGIPRITFANPLLQFIRTDPTGSLCHQLKKFGVSSFFPLLS